jgi:hypothetical protein
MVRRRFFSAVSNQARGPSFETPRKGAAPLDEVGM